MIFSASSCLCKVCIPSLTISPGFGEIDDDIHKYIHKPADEADENFDYSYLLKYATAFDMVARFIANSEITPEWQKKITIVRKIKAALKYSLNSPNLYQIDINETLMQFIRFSHCFPIRKEESHAGVSEFVHVDLVIELDESQNRMYATYDVHI